MDAKQVTLIVKVAITATFLPLLAFLLIYGMTHEEKTAYIGLGLAMISALGLIWGNPLDKNRGA